MSEGSKPDVFHSDDIHSEFLETTGTPVGKYIQIQIPSTLLSQISQAC